MEFLNFLRAILSDGGEPSSKRVAGFLILIFTLITYMVMDDMPLQDLVAFLGAAFLCFGISGMEKFANPKS